MQIQTTLDDFEKNYNNIIEGYTKEYMANRIFNWWFRNQGKNTSLGKKHDEHDFKILENRLKMLNENPRMFSWGCPEMDIEC